MDLLDLDVTPSCRLEKPMIQSPINALQTVCLAFVTIHFTWMKVHCGARSVVDIDTSLCCNATIDRVFRI